MILVIFAGVLPTFIMSGTTQARLIITLSVSMSGGLLMITCIQARSERTKASALALAASAAIPAFSA